MRLLVPSATIVVLSGTGRHQSVASAKPANNKDAANAILRSKFARDVEAAYKSDPMGKRQQLQKKRSLERKERSNNNKSNATKKVDVGILTARRETKEKDTPIYPVFLHGLKRMGKEEKQRFLQDEEVQQTCPSGCPQEFCDCGFANKEVKYCTKEMLSVCERGLVSRCVRTEDIEFYEQTYCPFAECVESNEPYENCSCGYYAAYCTLFYEYEESFDKCVTAECCEKTPDGEKATCIPALQPTSTPTGTPTSSMPPTASPTGTPAPTISTEPTISSKPTMSPTISSSPTTSPKPTPLASDSPSSQPSVSAKPTTSPTKAPTTEAPSFPPTVSPSDKPSTSPTIAPSASPTVSVAPTISTKPSSGPTSSTSPTSSGKPTASPSISVAPTSSPTNSPTVSVAPTSSPSTTSPTGKPITMKPTYEPTIVTYPPTLMKLNTPQPSGAISHSSNILIPLCVGVGGAALWLLGL